MAGYRATQKVIARAIGINIDTLVKYYSEDLVRGIQEADLSVATTALNEATGRRVVAKRDHDLRVAKEMIATIENAIDCGHGSISLQESLNSWHAKLAELVAPGADRGEEVVERCAPVPTAYIWWTKTQMGWKEQPAEHHITIDQQTPEQLQAELDAIRSRKRISDREGTVAPGTEDEL